MVLVSKTRQVTEPDLITLYSMVICRKRSKEAGRNRHYDRRRNQVWGFILVQKQRAMSIDAEPNLPILSKLVLPFESMYINHAFVIMTIISVHAVYHCGPHNEDRFLYAVCSKNPQKKKTLFNVVDFLPCFGPEAFTFLEGII